MRAHTTLRTGFRIGMTMAALAGISFAAKAAHADVNPPAASGGPNSSTGTAALKFEQTKGMDTTFDTGFIGPDMAQVRALIKLDPVKDGGPLFSVEMPKGALLEASWGTDKKIVLKPVAGAQTDGIVKVRHTLTPSLQLHISAFGLDATFAFDATSLLNKIPGSRFAYDSQATQKFAPWAFVPVDTRLNSPDLKDAHLFSIDVAELPEIVADNFSGELGLRAATRPTFSYKTTKIILAGAPGAITTAGAEVTLPAVDGDYMEVMTTVEGNMKVKGTMDIQPYLHLTRVLSSDNLDTEVGFTAFSKEYETADTKVAFQAATVHIPLPNVRVPTKGIDLGDVKPGGSASKAVEIQNTGEKDAVLSFKSSDPAFTVPGGNVTVPAKGKYSLAVKFKGDTAGPSSADITVLSNDPDSPQQVFKIGANGADVGQAEDAPPGGAQGDSGCGCKTAGTSSVPGWAGFGVMGLGAAVLFRRRRKNAA